MHLLALSALAGLAAAVPAPNAVEARAATLTTTDLNVVKVSSLDLVFEMI